MPNLLRCLFAVMVSISPLQAPSAGQPVLVNTVGGGHVEVPTEGPTIEDFLARPRFVALKISPDGRHFAATVPQEGRTSLVILARDNLAVTARVDVQSGQHISAIDWANDRQVVYSRHHQDGSMAPALGAGGLYKVSVDGSDAGQVGQANVALLDTLPEDDSHVLVYGLMSVPGSPIVRMDLDTGEAESWPLSAPGGGNFFTYFNDNAGQVRFADGSDRAAGQQRLFVNDPDPDWRPGRKPSNRRWHRVNFEDETGEFWDFIGFSGDNLTAYFHLRKSGIGAGVVAYELASRHRRQVLPPNVATTGRTLRSPRDRGVVALQGFDGKPILHVIASADPYVATLDALAQRFPGAYVTPTSFTRDGRFGVVLVESDVQAAAHYLLDTATGAVERIAERNDGLDPSRMSPMQAIRFQASDGLALDGWLTRPASRNGQPAPLVIMPHDGQMAGEGQSRWGYDPEVQWLASRGYAVLQLSGRGSDHRGEALGAPGKQQLGSRAQDDLTDGARWALGQGVTKAGHVCLYGHGDGAHAAMMGLVREPTLYACGIAHAGNYDLVAKNECTASRSTCRYINEQLGLDGVDLKAQSPTLLASRITAPVLLGGGARDRIARPAQPRALHAALKAAGVPVEMVIYPGEAHGLYRDENRLDWARRVLAHLDKTIGDGRMAPVVARQE